MINNDDLGDFVNETDREGIDLGVAFGLVHQMVSQE